MPSTESLRHRMTWRPGKPRTWPIESVRLDVDAAVERLIVVSDIHAYREPLAAVDDWLATLSERYLVFVNGDLFEGGMDAETTVDWARRHAPGRTTRGNHDSRIFAYLQGQTAQDPPTQWFADAELGGYQTLDSQQLDFVAQLPDQLNVHWRGKRIQLLHGHQNHHNTDYTPWHRSVEQLMPMFLDSQVDLTVIGHTHFPFVRHRNATCLANSGSISVPICRLRKADGSIEQRSSRADGVPDEDPRSSLLSITQADGKLEANIIRFTYDHERMLDRYAARTDLNMAINFRKHWISKAFFDPTVT